MKTCAWVGKYLLVSIGTNIEAIRFESVLNFKSPVDV